jgi:hypothetical protein
LTRIREDDVIPSTPFCHYAGPATAARVGDRKIENRRIPEDE